jgi:hypothetical protein
MKKKEKTTIDQIVQAASEGELAKASRLYYTSSVTWKEFQIALQKGLDVNLSKWKEGPPCLH